MSDNDLFSSAGIEAPPQLEPPPEKKAGQIAHRIYRPWHTKFHEKYAQTPAHINKVLKKFILDVVINGTATEAQVERALTIIGYETRPVTAMTLQYSLSKVVAQENTAQNSGANTGATTEEYHDFMVAGAPQDLYVEQEFNTPTREHTTSRTSNF